MEETETVLTLADFGALLRERRIHKGLTEENNPVVFFHKLK